MLYYLQKYVIIKISLKTVLRDLEILTIVISKTVQSYLIFYANFLFKINFILLLINHLFIQKLLDFFYQWAVF